MIDNTNAPFIVYGLQPVRECEADSITRMTPQKIEARMRENASLRLSGGYWNPVNDSAVEIPVGIATGILDLDPTGREIASELVASMTRCDERILVVDEVDFGKLPEWTTKALNSGGRVNECSNSVVAEVDAGLLASLGVFSRALPSRGIFIIAFKGDMGDLERDLRACSENNADAVDVMRRFERKYFKEVSPDTREAGDFQLWARLDGFDSCDLVVELPMVDVDTEWLDEKMITLACKHNVTLFKGNGLDDAESKSFFTEGIPAGPLPRSWTRVTHDATLY